METTNKGRVILTLPFLMPIYFWVHKLVRGKTYILDATDLPTTKRYRGCGVKKVVRKVWSKEGKEVEVVQYVYGYKLWVLMAARHKLVVAARVVKINEHENRWARASIK